MSVKRTLDYDLQYYQSILEPDVKMAVSIEDRQRVFLAYRALFEGQNAQVRQPKAIKRLINENKKSSTTLIGSFGLDKVVAILKTLLECEVFSSELKAKMAFPVLYKTSPEQDARHEASEAGAARVEAEELQEVECRANRGDTEAFVEEEAFATFGADHLEEEPIDPVEFDHVPEEIPWSSRVADTRIAADEANPQAGPRGLDGAKAELPSLYPTQFPFKVQHCILAKVQALLEECCFSFSTTHAPHLVRQYHWDCPEALELNKWTLIMIKHLSSIPEEAFKKSKAGVASVLVNVNRLRHSAVHRLRVSAKRIAYMIDTAVQLADMLQDTFKVSQLADLHKELENKIKSQELNKNYLESRLKDELDDIERQRRELDARGQRAIAAMVTEDEENMHFVGSLIEGRLRDIFDPEEIDKEVLETGAETHRSESEGVGEHAERGTSATDAEESSGPAAEGEQISKGWKNWMSGTADYHERGTFSLDEAIQQADRGSDGSLDAMSQHEDSGGSNHRHEVIPAVDAEMSKPVSPGTGFNAGVGPETAAQDPFMSGSVVDNKDTNTSNEIPRNGGKSSNLKLECR